MSHTCLEDDGQEEQRGQIGCTGIDLDRFFGSERTAMIEEAPSDASRAFVVSNLILHAPILVVLTGRAIPTHISGARSWDAKCVAVTEGRLDFGARQQIFHAGFDRCGRKHGPMKTLEELP